MTTDVSRILKSMLVAVGVVVLASGCVSAKKATPEATASAAPAPAPAPQPAPEAPVAAAPAPPADDTHVVVAGEHLWGISSLGVIYGDPYQWPLIYKRNIDQIEDADLIFPGQELNIQRDMSADQVQAAIFHAKTRGAWKLGEIEATDQEYLRLTAATDQEYLRLTSN